MLPIAACIAATHEAIGAWQTWLEAWEEWRTEIIEAIEVDPETIVIVTQIHARGRGSGISVDAEGAGVWQVRDGKIAYAKLFQSKARSARRGQSSSHLTGGPWNVARASTRDSPPGQRGEAHVGLLLAGLHAHPGEWRVVGRARAGLLDRALQVGDALLAEVGEHDGVEHDRRDAGARLARAPAAATRPRWRGRSVTG